MSHRSDRLSAVATSVTRFGRFDLLAQQLQSQPLLVGCRQPVASQRERLCCRTEPCPIMRIQIRVGQNRINSAICVSSAAIRAGSSSSARWSLKFMRRGGATGEPPPCATGRGCLTRPGFPGDTAGCAAARCASISV